jgi:hypothetical protein
VNDNMTMDSAIEGLVNDNITMESAIEGLVNDNISTVHGYVIIH